MNQITSVISPTTMILVAVLATARLTRLVTSDDIFVPVKFRIIDWAGAHSPERAGWWEALMSCPWCIGWWISVMVVAFIAVVPVNIAFLLLAPWALSYAVGTIEMWNNR